MHKLVFTALFSLVLVFAKAQPAPVDSVALPPEFVDLHGEFNDTNSKYFFREDDYKDSLPVYEKKFGERKDVPDSLKLAFFVALSHYPELYDAHIELSRRTMFTTMEARPTFLSVFKRKSRRHYKIFMNSRKGRSKGINLAKTSFNTRVGFFGHELAHLLSYEVRSSTQLIGMGFMYAVSKKYKKHTERETDMETIRRGMGYPLYESKLVILKQEDDEVLEDYRQNAIRNYMTDAEVLQTIRNIARDILTAHRQRNH